MAGFCTIIPDWLSTDYRTAARVPKLFESAPNILGVPIVFNLPGFGIVAGLTVVLVVGIRASVLLNTRLVI